MSEFKAKWQAWPGRIKNEFYNMERGLATLKYAEHFGKTGWSLGKRKGAELQGRKKGMDGPLERLWQRNTMTQRPRR